MKNKNISLIVLIYLFTVGCNNNSGKETTVSEKNKAKIVYQSERESFKNLRDTAFSRWKSNEIKAGSMQPKCPTYRSEEYLRFIEVAHDNENRWAYTKTLKKLYQDFNEDGLQDGLIVYEREDCECGNGYVGDNQVQVLFISNGDLYQKDKSIIAKMHNSINTKAINLRFSHVAYIEVKSVKSGKILGIYWDWLEDDPTGQPSIKRSFIYNYKTDSIVVD